MVCRNFFVIVFLLLWEIHVHWVLLLVPRLAMVDTFFLQFFLLCRHINEHIHIETFLCVLWLFPTMNRSISLLTDYQFSLFLWSSSKLWENMVNLRHTWRIIILIQKFCLCSEDVRTSVLILNKKKKQMVKNLYPILRLVFFGFNSQ